MEFMGTFSMVNYDDKRVSLPNFSSDTQISTPKAKMGGLQVLVVHSSGMCWYLSGWLGDEVDGVAPAAIIVTSIKIHDFFLITYNQ